MEWKTSISDIRDNKETIRGHKLEELIREKTFTEAIFLLLQKRFPKDEELCMLNSMLVAAIDHGIGTASAMTARIAASAKNSVHTALAAGILALGDLHGGAIEGAAKFFQEHSGENSDALVMESRSKHKRIPGYGHPILTKDSRADILFELAKKNGIYGKNCGFAEDVCKSLNAQSSKALPMNIDGAMAAILSDMGFDWRIVRGIFIIARAPGLIAHIYEEITDGNGLRRLSEGESKYDGA